MGKVRKNSIKNRIYNYAKDKYYFNIQDLRYYLEQKSIKYTDENLKKSLYRMNKDKVIYDPGRGWYSIIKEEFDLDKRPVKKIVNLIDGEEYKKVTSNIFNNFRITLADMLEYAERKGGKRQNYEFCPLTPKNIKI